MRHRSIVEVSRKSALVVQIWVNIWIYILRLVFIIATGIGRTIAVYIVICSTPWKWPQIFQVYI